MSKNSTDPSANRRGPAKSSPPKSSGWNFADVWEAVARRFPDALAQRSETREFTWAEFEGRAAGVAAALLASGVATGDRVALYMHNGVEYLEALFACFKARLVPVNTNYRYGPTELAAIWADAGARAVIFHAAFEEHCVAAGASSPVDVWLRVGAASASTLVPAQSYESAARSSESPMGCRSGDDLVLLYTGGTTGTPKGVMWRQDDLFVLLESLNGRDVTNLTGPDDYALHRDRPGPCVLPAAPLIHATGLWFCLPVLSQAGCVTTIAAPRLSVPEVLQRIVDHKVRGVAIVGDAFATPMLEALRAEPDRWDLSDLRVIFSSGVMFSDETKQALLEFAPRATIVDSLGSSETGASARSVTRPGERSDSGAFVSTGRARVIDDDGNDVAPGERGRLVVSGRLPLGYFNDPDKTAETFVRIDGAQHVVTGDWARIGENGEINLLGRGSSCINTGGEKVFPEEVEEVLKTQHDIVDAAVVGVPDTRFGQIVVAIVALREGATATEEQIIDEARATISGFKTPKRVYIVPSLGRGPNGKLDLVRLREDARVWCASDIDAHADSQPAIRSLAPVATTEKE